MRLYHFLNAEYGLLNIRHRRIKVGRINELNDPFEFLGAATKSASLRRRYQRLKDGLNDYMGLVCFSANWNNPVQWGHYADRHRGTHIAVKDGGEPPISTCPECSEETFVIEEGRCAACDFALPEDAACAVCGSGLSAEEYYEHNALCSYHAHTASKDD